MATAWDLLGLMSSLHLKHQAVRSLKYRLRESAHPLIVRREVQAAVSSAYWAMVTWLRGLMGMSLTIIKNKVGARMEP